MKWMPLILILAQPYIYGQRSIAYLNKPNAEVVSISSKKPANSHVIPIEIIRGMIYLQAELNGKTGLFILDTGAPTLVINQDHAKGPKAKALSLNADIQVTETRVASFQLGEIEHQNLEALALDLSHLERVSGQEILGLVGYNVFDRFALLLDFEQKLLFLTPFSQKITPSLYQPHTSLPFTLHEHLPIISVRVAGQVLNFGIDTGAASNLLDERFLSHPIAEVMEQLPKEEIQGLDQKVKLVEAGYMEVQTKEGWSLGKNKFLFTDLSFLRERTGCDIDGLLGSPFLAGADCSINYPKRKLDLWSK